MLDTLDILHIRKNRILYNGQVICYPNKLMQHGNNEYLFCWCYITEREGNAKGQRQERKSCVRFEYTLDNKGALTFRKEKSYRI